MHPNHTRLQAAVQHFQHAAPFLPMYLHLILSALFPIYAGAHASLSRPSSAAKPTRVPGRSRGVGDDGDGGDGEDDEDDEDDEADGQKMEGLSPQDAIVFPVMAAIVLAALYLLITRYGPDMVNVVLGVYFSGVGTVSVAKLLDDALHVFVGLLFPDYFAKHGRLCVVRHHPHCKAVAQGASAETYAAVLGSQSLRHLRAFVKQKFTTKLYIPDVVDFRANLTRVNALSLPMGICAVAYATFIDKPWWLTNLQGFAVCYAAMQLMSPTSFPIGSLILLGLFCYDIWAVFFTPLMVTVAKNLDVPIKLLFPRPDEGYSMLGLGDIVLPGIMIGLALRFDLYMFYLRKQKKRRVTTPGKKESEEVDKAPYVPLTATVGDRFWTRSLPITAKPEKLSTTFPKPYFTASVVGYVMGMLATLGVMSVFQNAQPALLYLVPGVLFSLWGMGLFRGELKHMWEFSEAVTGEQTSDDEKEAEQQDEDKDDRSWLQALKDDIFGKAQAKKSADEKAKDGKSKKRDAKTSSSDVIVVFSISRFPPRATQVKSSSSPEDDETSSSENDHSDLDDHETVTPSDGSLDDTVLVANKE